MSNKIIKYFGGKGGEMLNKILQLMPTKKDIYIEPFGGSATVLLNQKTEVEIYNDLNKNVYSLFKVISDADLFQEFKKMVDCAYYSETLRKDCKEAIKKPDISIVERAFCYFYINRTSHNGVGGFSCNISPRRNMSKCVSDYLSAIDGLYDFHQRLSRVICTNKNALELIEKYDGSDVFMYLDPPYHHSTRTGTRYEVDMNNQQHEVLIDTVLQCKSKIMLSGYDCPLYGKLVKSGWLKYDFTIATVSANKKPKTKTETIWLNYKIEERLFS